jgi:membrane-associated HD superfamily phosphohydrolase
MLRRRPVIAVSRTQAALFGLALGLGAVALIAPIIPTGQDLSEGSTAPQTLVAQRSATYESQVLTDIAKDESAKAVGAFQLPANPAIRDQQLVQLGRFVDDVRSIRQRGGSQQQQLDALNQLESARDFSAAGRTAILALDAATFERLVTLAPSALSEVMSASIGEVPSDQQGGNSAKDDRINAYLAGPSRQPLTQSEYTALQELLHLFVVPNAKIDETRTKQAQDDARNRVQPQVVTYSRGQVIAGQGATLSVADVEALRETGYLADGFDAARVASGAVMAAGLATLLGAFVYYLQPFPSSPVRRMLICGAAILGALAAARAILPVVLPDEERLFLAFAIPVGTAAMVAVSFTTLPFAAIVAVLVGLFAAFVGASATDLPGADFTGSLEAFELARPTRRRAWSAL